MEEFVNLEVWALLLQWRGHQRILRAKEVPEGTMLLLAARAKGVGNPVIAVSWRLGLWLHLLHELR